MADCPSLSRCIFFNDHMANRPATAEMMKVKYCRSTNIECARWMIATRIGRDSVPRDLFPNQLDRAKEMLAQAS